MGNTLFLILDAISTNFTYGPQNWTDHPRPLWYGGTLRVPSFPNLNVSTPGSFEISFEGTSIAFTGTTPIPTYSQSITVSIDDGTPYTTYYMDPTPQTYIQWYQSPLLSEGHHIIKVDDIDGAAIDYATITVGQETPLPGKTVIVDSDDPSVHYSGSWTRNTDRFIAGSTVASPVVPFRNSTYQSKTPGDTITIQFTGTSAVVYGIFSWGNIGTLAATYTIDRGTPVSGSHTVTTTSTEYLQGNLDFANFPLFSVDALSVGDHTLVMNVTQCANHIFIFDYLTYSPSFANLASMPNLVFTTTASGSTSTSSQSAGVASQTASHLPQQSAGSHVTLVGAIVGGSVGGLLALAFLVFWLRRRGMSKENLVLPFNDVPKGSLPDDPNTSPPVQLEEVALQNATHSPAPGGIRIDPFRDIGPRATGDTALSVVEIKRKRGVNSSGTSRGPPAVSSTTRSPGDVASESLHPVNHSGIGLPIINLPSGISVNNTSSESEGPPSYDAIAAHLSPS